MPIPYQHLEDRRAKYRARLLQAEVSRLAREIDDELLVGTEDTVSLPAGSGVLEGITFDLEELRAGLARLYGPHGWEVELVIPKLPPLDHVLHHPAQPWLVVKPGASTRRTAPSGPP